MMNLLEGNDAVAFSPFQNRLSAAYNYRALGPKVEQGTQRLEAWVRSQGLTTNQTLPTFCPVVSPGLLSLAQKYSG